MKFDVLTLFPSMFSGPFDESIIGRASNRGILEIAFHNIRDFATDRHKTVDDSPYGGGSGMVMKVEPLVACIESVKSCNPDSTVIMASPRGVPFSQDIASKLSEKSGLIILCGRYEGVDERVSELCVDMEISIGDFVLTGGELAAMVIIDAVSRLIPGVLGSCLSAHDESFSNQLLEYPQYTRPQDFRGLNVPEILLSGNHKEIDRWRRDQAILKTFSERPDLLEGLYLTPMEQKLVASLVKDNA